MKDLDNLKELDKLNMKKPADDDDLLAGLEELDKKEKENLGKIKEGFVDKNLAKNITTIKVQKVGESKESKEDN